MPNKPKGRGGAFGAIGQGAWLIVVAGLILAFVQVNDIKSPKQAYDYFRGWSDAVDECIGEKPVETQLADCRRDGIGGESDLDPIPPGSGGDLGDGPIVISETTNELKTQLDNAPVVSGEDLEYDRADWAHWSDFNKDGCDTREEVLKAQGENVKVDSTCRAISGEWIDPYTLKKITDSSSIDIDHILPLGWVADHGGLEWSKEKKEQYANDQSLLIISSASANRSKSDQGPSTWMPENGEFHCAYAGLWIKGLNKYNLAINKADKKALSDALATCA